MFTNVQKKSQNVKQTFLILAFIPGAWGDFRNKIALSLTLGRYIWVRFVLKRPFFGLFDNMMFVLKYNVQKRFIVHRGA